MFAAIALLSRWLLRRRAVAVAACVTVVSFAAARGVPAQSPFLRHGVRIDSVEFAAIERGEVVVRVLPTRDTRDVAVLGVVRIGAARDAYLRRVQNFRSWLRTPTRTHVGIFSEPAALADVEQVVVPRQDIGDLKDCRPGDCTTKLAAAEMQKLREEVDWSANDLQARVTTIARRRLIRYVGNYRDDGNASMPTYDDRAPVRASDAFAATLAQSTYLSQVAPAIATYLKTYPRGRPVGLSDVVYWSEDAVPRLRPILSVTHAVVFTPPEVAGISVVASKQIYANHYFEGALEVVGIMDRAVDGTAGGSYLVVERRFRFDNLPRGLLNIRGRATSGLRDQLRDLLLRERAQTERSVASP